VSARRRPGRRRAGVALAGLLLAVPGPDSPAALACDAGLPHYRPEPAKPAPRASYLTADGGIRIVGYNDMRQLLEALDSLFAAAHPGARFDLMLEGTRTAPPALASGQSLFAPMGAPFEPQALEAYVAQVGRAPVAFAVAHDSLNPAARSSPIAIFAPATNPLRRLTLAHVRRLFAAARGGGTVTWGEVGLTGAWATKPVHPIGLSAQTAIGRFFSQAALDGGAYSGAFRGLPQSRDVVAAVAADPQSIGVADLSLATPQVRALALAKTARGPFSVGAADDLRAGRYLLDRKLLIYLRRGRKGDFDLVAREYLRLALSCEGQDAIGSGSLGYLPLNAREAAAERARLR
jgi:phosphate transport system substrate-binding protein